jgi:hypothetical protein
MLSTPAYDGNNHVLSGLIGIAWINRAAMPRGHPCHGLGLGLGLHRRVLRGANPRLNLNLAKAENRQPVLIHLDNASEADWPEWFKHLHTLAYLESYSYSIHHIATSQCVLLVKDCDYPTNV